MREITFFPFPQALHAHPQAVHRLQRGLHHPALSDGRPVHVAPGERKGKKSNSSSIDRSGICILKQFCIQIRLELKWFLGHLGERLN